MKDDYLINNYTPEQLYREMIQHGGKRVRYNAVESPVGIIRRLVLFSRYGKWVKTERNFIPVFPGEIGYDDAMYESDVIYDRQEMERLSKLSTQ